MKQIIPILILVLVLANGSPANSLAPEADRFYALRGTDFNEETLLASSTNIDKAIALYIQAIENTSGSEKEEITWKLIRAYHFKGRYTTSDRKTRKSIYDKAIKIGAEAIKQFPESAGIHVWMALVWGAWAQEHGAFKAARKGVAGKIKEHCEKAIELDETFDEAAPYRVLGTVHLRAPKIPLILRWPSKKRAVELLQKAYEIAPQNLFTRQFLAEALYERDQKRRAMELMEEILKTDGVVRGVVEDAMVKKEAAAILRKWKKEG